MIKFFFQNINFFSRYEAFFLFFLVVVFFGVIVAERNFIKQCDRGFVIFLPSVRLIDWLIARFIARSTDWLIDWLIARLIGWLIARLIDWLLVWLVDWFVDWLIDWLNFFLKNRRIFSFVFLWLFYHFTSISYCCTTFLHTNVAMIKHLDVRHVIYPCTLP